MYVMTQRVGCYLQQKEYISKILHNLLTFLRQFDIRNERQNIGYNIKPI